MRDFAKIAPTFWTRGSGKRLRGNPDAQVLALYLFTCPSANMIGLYYVPFVTMAHETGLGVDRTRSALADLRLDGCANYDEEHELAWVPNMAAYQIGDVLRPGDKRRGAVLTNLELADTHPFGMAFRDRYAAAYGLEPIAPKPTPPDNPVSPSEAPPKPLGRGIRDPRDETEKEKETERETATDQGASAPRPTEPPEPVSMTRLRTVKPKASRLPADWEVSPALRDWAKCKGISDRDIEAIAERFKDHWLQSSRPNATKADWSAAFRSWARRDVEDGKVAIQIRNAATAPPAPTAEQLEQRRKSQATIQAALAQMDARRVNGAGT